MPQRPVIPHPLPDDALKIVMRGAMRTRGATWLPCDRRFPGVIRRLLGSQGSGEDKNGGAARMTMRPSAKPGSFVPKFAKATK